MSPACWLFWSRLAFNILSHTVLSLGRVTFSLITAQSWQEDEKGLIKLPLRHTAALIQEIKTANMVHGHHFSPSLYSKECP